MSANDAILQAAVTAAFRVFNKTHPDVPIEGSATPQALPDHATGMFVARQDTHRRVGIVLTDAAPERFAMAVSTTQPQGPLESEQESPIGRLNAATVLAYLEKHLLP